MTLEWDEPKRQANLESRGLDFARAIDLLEGDALEYLDDREDYGEERVVAIGMIDRVVVVLVYTMRGEVYRIISLRKAEKHEQEAYLKAFY